MRAQLEGDVIQTVSRTLKKELKWDRSHVTSVDWQGYPILRFPEVPVVESELINRPSDPPWGAGEPAAAVVPQPLRTYRPAHLAREQRGVCPSGSERGESDSHERDQYDLLTLALPAHATFERDADVSAQALDLLHGRLW